MRRKYNMIIILFFVVIFSIAMPLFDNNDMPLADVEDEGYNVVLIDETVYDDLPISSLYVDNFNAYDADNINWYSRGGIHYLLLPKGYDRSKIRVHFSDKGNVAVSVYDEDENFLGKLINDTCNSVLTHDTIVLKTNINSKKVHTYKIKIVQSDLPSVQIRLDGGARAFSAINNSLNHKVGRSGKLYVVDEDGNETYTILERMRGRGNATWKRAKKPYQIKTSKKIDIFGMGSGKTYNLLANTLDGPLVRNSLFLEFAKDIELESALDYQQVDLYVNGNYHGLYTLAEKPQVKENRVETDEVNDFLFEIENHQAGSNYVVTKHNIVVTIKNPDVEKMSASNRNKVKRQALAYLNKMEDLMYGGKSDEEIKKYIDYESFAKFFWVQEISFNYDALRGSNYFYTKDGKLYAGPGWDFDNSLNRSYNYGNINTSYLLDSVALNSRTRGNWYKALARKQGFSDAIDKVYYDYYDEFNNLPKVLDGLLDETNTSIKMNYMKWDFHTPTASKPGLSGNNSLSGSISVTKRALNARLSLYKGQYNSIIYRNFKYTYTDSKGITIEKELRLNETNYLPKDVGDKITIYGDDKVLKEVDTNELKDLTLTYTNNARSNVKKHNRLHYTFYFERDV